MRILVVSALSVALLHLVYPTLKGRLKRPRPFQSYPDLHSPLRPLDDHSFPSGHIMTLTAVLVPLGASVPAAVPSLLVLWTFVAWARIACAHHYPSDVLAGAVLALSVACPISAWWLPEFPFV